MARKRVKLVPVFMPSLASVLLRAEDQKGKPLTPEQVIALRDGCTCVMSPRSVAARIERRRGYRDVDPENCWYDFQMLRRKLGRKPDLDPGAKVLPFPRDDAAMKRAVKRAKASLAQFRRRLRDAASTGAMPMLKIRALDGERRLYLWLNEAREARPGFVAKVFELPAGIDKYRVGDEVKVATREVVDWMVNDRGTLHGGFTLRVHRSRLSKAERTRLDKHLGVRRYA